MKNHRVDYSIDGMCASFGVSRSGYYAWLGRKPSPRAGQRQQLDERIKALFEKHQCRYGAKRIQQQIQQDDQQHYNLKTVAASLQRQGLVAKAARKFKATTYSKHNLPVLDNRLEQDFSATAPNQKWVSDITYLWTEQGWLYSVSANDDYNYEIFYPLNINKLLAIFKRKRPKGVIVHSDRGSQYCSHAYRQLLEKHQLLGSMSAKGNCYDNACAESFFHSLKVEAIHGERFPTRETLRQTVFEYIESHYNRLRLHSANGYRTPIDFETDFYQQLAS